MQKQQQSVNDQDAKQEVNPKSIPPEQESNVKNVKNESGQEENKEGIEREGSIKNSK